MCLTAIFGTYMPSTLLAFCQLLFLLIAAHALADFPLQGQYLSDAKNPRHPIGAQLWRWALPYHGMIHGGFVFLITGSFGLALGEVALHIAVDYNRCMNRISFNQDQTLHIAYKVFAAFYATVIIGHSYFLPIH
jgi:hypothetical protein